MKKINYKPIAVILLLIGLSLVIGGTIAYYTSTDTFNNEFNASSYVIEVEETFESPDDWVPGDTTQKEIIATNKGDTVAAVRIKLTPSWKDKNGNPLNLMDEGNNEAAIINYSFDKDYKWIKEGDWYYYVRPIDKNESTTTLIDSVTFNPLINIDGNSSCETDGETEAIVCTSASSEYGGGTYELKVNIETCQFNKYREIWNTNVSIESPEKKTGTLMVTTSYDSTTIFGKHYDGPITKASFEKISFLDVVSIPNNSVDSWDCSVEQNESIMCWYTDKDSNGKYELYVGQEGGVLANPNSYGALCYYTFVNEINVGNLNTSNVTNMDSLFYNTGYPQMQLDTFIIRGLDKWNTSNVTDMSNMFKYTGRSADNWIIGDISNWDTSKVTNMHNMFERAAYQAKKFDINVGKWDVSNVTNMASMFDSAGYRARYWSIGDLSNWDTRKVTTMHQMFAEAGKDATTWNSIGTLKVYATDLFRFMAILQNAKATINIYSNPTEYTFAFSYVAKTPGSLVTVNYSSDTTNIDSIIATKDSDSNVVKGSLLD